jgi:hypothetical protein
MSELLRPTDLKKISEDVEAAKAREYAQWVQKKEEEEKKLRDAFIEREIHPEAKERVNAAVRRAAEQGKHEIQVFTFPATYCSDAGRRINNNDPDWPSSLEGFPKKAYDFFDKELRPMGYKLAVQIIDYPNGMPGNVGMFLKW